MTGAQSARNVLMWIEIGWAYGEEARRSCRGRKDVERLRLQTRQWSRSDVDVSIVSEAARRRDLSFLAMYLATEDMPNALLVHEGGWAVPVLERMRAAA